MSPLLQMIAEQVGRDRAKTAGIGDFASFTAGLSNAVKQLGVSKAAPAAGSLVSKAKRMMGGPLGWKGNALLLGGTVGASILGSKVMNRAPAVLSKEQHPAVYGPGQYGYQLPNGVNAYGTPQVGTSL